MILLSRLTFPCRPSSAGSGIGEARPTQHQQHDFALSTAPLPAPAASARAPKHPAPTQAQSTSSGSEWSQLTASNAAQPALPPALWPTQKSPILPAALQAVLSSPAGTSPIKPSITPRALGAHGPPGGQIGQPKAPAGTFPILACPSPSACLSVHGLPCSQSVEVTVHGSKGPSVSYAINAVQYVIAYTHSVKISALQSAQQERPRHGRSRSLSSCGAPREHRPGSRLPLR